MGAGEPLKEKEQEESQVNKVTIVLLVILVILIGVLIALYFYGKKAQKAQAEQQAQIQATKQTMSIMAIDKKKMRIKESGLPQFVIDKTPKYLRWTKLPIVKAKVMQAGGKVQILIADEKVFDLIPLKKEIKADISGLYIVGVKGLRGGLEKPVEKKSFWAKLRSKAMDTVKKDSKEQAKKGSSKKNTKAASTTTGKKKKGA